MKKKTWITTEDFIRKARKVHGDRYDYGKSEYNGSHVKLTITCPKHGDFQQEPCNHISNHCNCPKCVSEKQSLDQTMNTEQFISAAKKIHGDLYDYSCTVYAGFQSKVNIICWKHGMFCQKAVTHLQGHGCQKCKSDATGERLSMKKDEFLEKCLKVHGTLYDYGCMKYVDSLTKIHIICRKHGGFLQSPRNHVAGQGCPKCRSSWGESRIRNYLIEHGVLFTEQHTFSDCKYKRKLKFDFAIWNDGSLCLIEYQGEQHFRPVRRSRKDVSGDLARRLFEVGKARDEVKREYCRKNGIKLVEICYKDFENIEKILGSNVKPLGI